MLLTIAHFAAIRQKSAYHAKYLRISSWTYLDLLYRFGRRSSGNDYSNICLAVTQGRCYGNQLNLGDVSRRRAERPLLFALAFDNGLADLKSAFNRFNGNNPATSYPSLVYFCPIISEFTLLKRAIFAVIRPQLSLFVTLTFWNWWEDRNFDCSGVISNHVCTSCRNLVRFGWVNPEFIGCCTVGVEFFLGWLQVRSVGSEASRQGAEQAIR